MAAPASAPPALRPGPLAPSELVLFHGERLPPLTSLPTRINAPKLPTLHGDEKVPASDLGMGVLAAAVLANERAGSLRLAVEDRKALFGLRRTRVLTLQPVGPAPAWPAGSLEARLHALATARTGNGASLDAEALVHAVLEADSENGWHQAVDLVVRGLADRGLLAKEEYKRLKVFTMERHVLTPEGRAVADAEDPAPAVDLVASARGREEAWKLLSKAITRAVSRRTEVDDEDFD